MPKQNNKKINTTIFSSIKNPLIKISKEVFTVYVGLVASGYEFSLDKELADKIRNVKWDDSAVEYFKKARTPYCAVNPYWPRGAMLVSASLDIKESTGYEYSDFNKMKENIDRYNNFDSKENDKETELWLLQLPNYYGLVRENKEFDNLYAQYVKKVESATPRFVKVINEAKKRVISKFKITEVELPEIGLIPNILGMPFNADFEKIDNIIYVISAQPDTSCIIHEYLHNILGHGIKNNMKRISKYVYLLNPVFERMFIYKYAWAKDTSSWLRIFEENLVRATTIWVNELNAKEAMFKAINLENEGFAYVPVLLEQLNNNWCGITGFCDFIDNCLQACESKYNSLLMCKPHK